MGNKFYTPDGFNDQFPGLCGFKRDLESKLRNLFLLNGYDEIETPGVEYFDVYKEFVKEEELYKFTDSTGRLLCNRYDGTMEIDTKGGVFAVSILMYGAVEPSSA